MSLATVELAWTLGKDVLTPPLFLPEIDELLELSGLFLLMPIGIELLRSTKVCSARWGIHLEAVFVVALIVAARTIIVMDPSGLPAGTLLGVAAIALGLTAGYCLVRRSRFENGAPDSETRA